MSTIPDLTATLDLFFGEASSAETRIYALLARERSSDGLKLSGSLTGPYCRYAHTLPATVPLVDQGPGDSLLSQAVVPDPCFWTPELPFLYQARVELRRGTEVLDIVERPLGIRPLGSRGRRFYYEGQTWVLRGVQTDRATVSELHEFREADAAMFVDDPSNELCAAASEQGVLIVARLRGNPALAAESIRRLARHAAVGFIVLDGESAGASDPRSLARNVVFVQCVNPANLQPPATWARALLCPFDGIARLAQSPLPLIAYRPASKGTNIADRRALCDLLQRDLAGAREIAGYLVGSSDCSSSSTWDRMNIDA